MIFCFSGTGNSLAVARMLAGKFDDVVTRIQVSTPSEFDLTGQERIIWVTPVYSWGLPPVVRKFIRSVTLDGINSGMPHFLVCTCGDDVGLTADMWRKEMLHRGWNAVSAHSVIMPNNYVLLPGFDTDAQSVIAKKIADYPLRVDQVAQAILSGSSSDSLIKGSMAWLKSKVIYPLFVRFYTSPKPFHYTSQCVGCGKCASACPMCNINMTDGRPVWSQNCAICLACYHSCPHHAVAYGRQTNSKGQWLLSDALKD